MAEPQNIEMVNHQQPYQMMGIPQDPIMFLVMAPFLPLILFINALQTMSMSPMMPAAQLPVAQSQGSQYKNNERWVIERNLDGSIKSLNVSRDAKVS